MHENPIRIIRDLLKQPIFKSYLLTLTLDIVIWIFVTFDTNLEIERDFSKYLKEKCWQCSGQYFFLTLPFCVKDLTKNCRLLLATVSINEFRK